MNETAPAYANRFWAKWDKDGEEIHLLEHHLADVGACFEALAEQPTIRNRLAAAADAGAPLDETTLARLCVFAALHDIGKVNVGFQTKTWDPSERGRGIGKAGHTTDMVPILEGKDRDTLAWFTDALGWYEMLDWDDNEGLTVSALFAASMSHHGEPLNLDSSKQAYPKIWRPFRDLNPEAQVSRIGQLIRIWFPGAFADNPSRLPSAPAFQHMFLGLCTLADWIGSDRERFPYCNKYCDRPNDDYFENTARPAARKALKEMGLDIRKQREAVASADFSDSSRIFAHIPDFAPNAMQRAASGIPLDERLAIIESETGSGKTEAALWRFARLYEAKRVDSLYFALPTRAAAVQIHGRVKEFSAKMLPDCDTAPLPVLAVPGYVRAGDFDGRHLPDYKVWWEDGFGGGRRWAAESSKRYLAAQIAVGTVDQAMMAALQVRHSHMRAACLSRSLLVIDEVHASDPYMRAIIEELLKAHLGAGGYALLMSATLGSSARTRWLAPSRSRRPAADMPLADAIAKPYPSIAVRDEKGDGIRGVGANDRAQKSVRVEPRPLMGDFAQTAKVALDAARKGAKTLIIRNTVGYAIDTQRALETAAGDGEGRAPLFGIGDIPAPHHSRFAASDRRLLDAEVETALGKERRRESGIAVVGTQTLEQSLDIDADLLITDLCPMDVLLQRIGRLHRHAANDAKRPDGYRTPRCIILTPQLDGNDGDLSPLLKKDGPHNGLGPEGYVYPDLRISQLTLRLIAKSAAKGKAWHIPDMNRELVESATHEDALREFDEMGDEWVELGKEIDAVRFADNLTARHVIVKRDKTFLKREVRFVTDVEDKIRTRLGDDSVEVEFDPPPPSPFDGAKIESISIPIWLVGEGNAPPNAPIAPEKTPDGFEFDIGDRRFAYDRMGLRRV